MANPDQTVSPSMAIGQQEDDKEGDMVSTTSVEETKSGPLDANWLIPDGNSVWRNETLDLTNSASEERYHDHEEEEFFYVSDDMLTKQQQKNSSCPKTQRAKDRANGVAKVTEEFEKRKARRRHYSKRQLLVFLCFMLVNFCSAACVSLQAPFYPAEAEKKGATASEYGFVFGIFELVVFLISPLYGKFIGVIGPKFLLTAGIFLTSTCCILFGLLSRVEGRESFLALSFSVRIVEAIGEAGYLTGSFTIIAQEFSDYIASTFALLEAAFGLGLIAGPTIGGLLYEVGGYSLPFAVTGSVLLVAAVVTYFILPGREHEVQTSRLSIFGLLKISSVAIAGFVTTCASISIGFLVATLEPHLRQFELTPAAMGSMFIISGGVYAFTAPLWGRLCESVISPCFACGIGGVLLGIAYLLIGPSPIMPFDTMLSVSIVGLVFHGLGVAAELVGSFSLAHRDALRHGFPDNLDTYGLVSGYWTSLFALGAFIGPSAAGILLDFVGFAKGSQTVLALHIIAIGLTGGWLLLDRYRKDSVHSAHFESSTHLEQVPLLH